MAGWMKAGSASASAVLGCLLAGQAAAATLTLDVSNLHSAQGRVMVALCSDPNASIPGACTTYTAVVPAKQGSVTARIENVTPGLYAIQAFHDENGNFRPDLPAEGFAFGNDMAWPPTFKGASLQVEGDAHTALTMTYLSGSASADVRVTPVASQGAAAPEGIQRIDLREGGLYGEFYLPQRATPAPALLLIGGSEGGVDTISQMATSFAKAGYPALALAYWRAPGLPQSLEGIPLEYFDRAVAWLKKQPQVAPGSIGMLGWSRGAEAALLVAARNPSIRLTIATAPSGVVWLGMNLGGPQPWKPAWTVNGKPLPCVTPDARHYRPDQPMAQMFTASFETMDARPDAAIAVEKIHGDVLLISGGDDHIQPSTRFADRIVARLQALRFKGAVLHLDYPAAGHSVFAGEPGGPMARSIAGSIGIMGGTPEANAQAQADSWRRTLDFLHAHLDGER